MSETAAVTRNRAHRQAAAGARRLIIYFTTGSSIALSMFGAW